MLIFQSVRTVLSKSRCRYGRWECIGSLFYIPTGESALPQYKPTWLQNIGLLVMKSRTVYFNCRLLGSWCASWIMKYNKEFRQFHLTRINNQRWCIAHLLRGLHHLLMIGCREATSRFTLIGRERCDFEYFLAIGCLPLPPFQKNLENWRNLWINRGNSLKL